MGYRLDIFRVGINQETHKREVTNVYYGTKLYGYCGYEKSLLSYMYLKSIGKVDGDEYFNYGSNISIPVNKLELTIFLNLYSIDLDNYCKDDEDYENGWFLKDEEISPLLLDTIEDRAGIDETYLIEWC